MEKKQNPGEVVVREYPKTTYWLDGKQVRGAGNLVLTNERLVFLRQIESLSEKEVETLTELSQAKDTSRLIQFSVNLHKSNFQLPLSSITSVKMGILTYVPIRPHLKVFYKTDNKKVKMLSFMFTVPFLKRLLMSEFPTLGWILAINSAVKKRRKALARK